MFVLLLAAVLAAGFAVSSASAGVETSGYTVPDYWFETIDVDGKLIDPLDADFQNSAQYVIYDSTEEIYKLIAHINYNPDPDNQTTAQLTTAVTAIQVWDGSAYVPCLVGATFQAPASYVQTTGGAQYDIPYLQFQVTFTTYDNHTGKVDDEQEYVAYFNLDQILPAPYPPVPAVFQKATKPVPAELEDEEPGIGGN
jgi:hypothetical protein